MAAPKKYSDELRERATRLALESGRPIAHVAQDLGVHKEALRTWVRQAKADAAGGTPSVLSSAERERAEALARRGPRAAPGERDPAGGERVFREGARRDPAEVSAFIEAQKALGFAVELVCRTLGVSRSAHYERLSGRRSPRAIRDEQLVATIRRLHEANFCAYGYRKMHLALRRAGVEDVGRDRVKRLMREHGIQGAKRRGKPWRTTVPDPDAARRPDLVERDFTATGPDRLYVADFTYLRCWEGAAVLRVRDRRLQPPHRRLAAHRAHARLAGLRRAADGRLHPPTARRRRQAHPSQRPRIAIHRSGLRAGPRRPRRAAVGRIGRRRLRQRAWPRASSTRSRPSSSPIASGAPAPSSSSRSSSTSAGSTTTASTNPSATSHPPSSKP